MRVIETFPPYDPSRSVTPVQGGLVRPLGLVLARWGCDAAGGNLFGTSGVLLAIDALFHERSVEIVVHSGGASPGADIQIANCNTNA
jgi:hypothetical protein